MLNIPLFKLSINLLTGFPVLVSAADEKSLRENVLSQDIYKYRIIMLTQECLLKQTILNKLYDIRKDITGIIVDNSQHL